MPHNPEPGSRPATPAPSRVSALVEELARLARTDPDALSVRIAALGIREQAELALRLPAAQRLELVLHAPDPQKLVRALPDFELYLAIREVGPEEALPLLALASPSQLQHVIDLEAWRKDRLDADRTGAWVALLVAAGEDALKRFLRVVDDELLALLLKSWVRIEPIEAEDSPDIGGLGQGDTEQGMLAPDGYHRYTPTIPEHTPAIRSLLQRLFVTQPERYQRVLWGSMWELGSELEEQALLWRQSRLEEHGFPRWDEALEIYAPPAGIAERPAPPPAEDTDALVVPRSPLRLGAGRGALVQAIDRLPDDLRERALHEMVSLANHVLVANAADTGDPVAHLEALESAAGFVELALRSRGATDPAAMGARIAALPLLELFREGYARATELQGRARHVARTGWIARHPRALELLDTPIRERVAGLLEPRPRFWAVEGDPPRGRPRTFRAPAELDESRVALELAEALGRLLADDLAFDLESAFAGGDEEPPAPRFGTLFSTLLAWHAARGELRLAPLPADVAAAFLRQVASRRTAGPDAPARALAALLARIGELGPRTPREAAGLEAFGRACLERIAEECSQLDPGVPPDPRRVTALRLEPAG